MAKKHPNKDINEAVKYAIKNGWAVEMSNGHAWAQLKCPYNEDTCRNGIYCQVSIWSTPRNPTNHAKQLKKIVDGCEAKDKKKEQEDE